MTDRVVDQRLSASVDVVIGAINHIQRVFEGRWPKDQRSEYLTFKGFWIARPITRKGRRYVEVNHDNSDLVTAVCDAFPQDKILRRTGHFYFEV